MRGKDKVHVWEGQSGGGVDVWEDGGVGGGVGRTVSVGGGVGRTVRCG